MNLERKYAWGHSRRFNSYSEYMKKEFGGRVQKLSIDAGFTCPNRDGKAGTGGCTFCNNKAFNPSYCSREKTISQQIQEGIDFHKIRYRRAEKFLAYFQPYSNTYAPLETLKNLYQEALAHPDVAGIIIGTRPDCVDDKILDYIEELSHRTFITIEFGIESCYDASLLRINRGHNFQTTIDALRMTSERGIRTGGHIIIGLPGETREMILDEAGILSELPVDHLKFHQLQVVKGTSMEKDYLLHPEIYKEYELNEYLELMAEFIELLRPDILIERIAGEAVIDYDLRPSWGFRNDQVLNRFERKLEEMDSWQGKRR